MAEGRFEGMRIGAKGPDGVCVCVVRSLSSTQGVKINGSTTAHLGFCRVHATSACEARVGWKKFAIGVNVVKLFFDEEVCGRFASDLLW